MSEIKETVTVTESRTVGHRCDGCGKDRRGDDGAEHWHGFLAGVCVEDGLDWYDACSPACYLKLLADLVSRRWVDEIDEMHPRFVADLLRHISEARP